MLIFRNYFYMCPYRHETLQNVNKCLSQAVFSWVLVRYNDELYGLTLGRPFRQWRARLNCDAPPWTWTCLTWEKKNGFCQQQTKIKHGRLWIVADRAVCGACVCGCACVRVCGLYSGACAHVRLSRWVCGYTYKTLLYNHVVRVCACMSACARARGCVTE